MRYSKENEWSISCWKIRQKCGMYEELKYEMAISKAMDGSNNVNQSKERATEVQSNSYTRNYCKS